MNDREVEEKWLETKLRANSTTHAIPEWNDCVEHLPIVFEDHIKSGNSTLTGLPFRITMFGVEFFPWQIPGILHIDRMIDSVLGGTLISDEAGLGKTMQLLGAIALRSLRHETAAKEFNGKSRSIRWPRRLYIMY